MTLKEYKEKYKLKNAQLARLFKVSQSCVCYWLSGKVNPNTRHSIKIYKATKGEVTFQELGLV